jgi:cbb3-type cytochrome oxidase subunit 3
MRLTVKIITHLLLISWLFIGCITFAYGQNNSQTNGDSKTEQLEKEVKEGNDKIKQLTDSTQELKEQNAILSKQLDTLTTFFYGVAGLISIVLVVGTVTSFISWNTDRKRSNETYYMAKRREEEVTAREKTLQARQDELYSFSLTREKASSEREKVLQARQDELYNLSLTREKESSERDKRIFAQSTDTLVLVNETLSLAKDASERASKSLEVKLDRRHDELEREAIDLIDESKAYRNYKVLVEDSNFRSNLQTLALEIAGLQNNQNILDKEVALHPHCCFIRGMEFHLNQHFKPAIKYWKQAKDHPKVNNALKIMTLFWIGYEQNNKGEFENAASNFELASSIATGAQCLELDRIRIESKFFHAEKFSTEQIIPEMEALYEQVKEKEASDEFQRAKSSIAGTLGNMYYQLGNELSSKNTQESVRYYRKAKETFAEAPIRNKWNWFGYGEACFKLGEIDEAEECFLNRVKPEAEFEYSTRPEPRTKVLGQTTVLICSIRVPSLHENVTTLYNLIKTTLGSVDTHVTVYSQFQRRNVFKDVFLEQLNQIMMEFENMVSEES